MGLLFGFLLGLLVSRLWKPLLTLYIKQEKKIINDLNEL